MVLTVRVRAAPLRKRRLIYSCWPDPTHQALFWLWATIRAWPVVHHLQVRSKVFKWGPAISRLNNSRRARSPRSRQHKTITVIMEGSFTAEATIKNSTLGEEPTHVFGNDSWREKLFHGEKGRKTEETHPESAFGWVLIGWALGSSLKGSCSLSKHQLPVQVLPTHSSQRAFAIFPAIAVSSTILSGSSNKTQLRALVTVRKTTSSKPSCSNFGRPLAKKVMSHLRDGPGVTAPLRTNTVPLRAVWNLPPFRYPPPP